VGLPGDADGFDLIAPTIPAFGWRRGPNPSSPIRSEPDAIENKAGAQKPNKKAPFLRRGLWFGSAERLAAPGGGAL